MCGSAGPSVSCGATATTASRTACTVTAASSSAADGVATRSTAEHPSGPPGRECRPWQDRHRPRPASRSPRARTQHRQQPPQPRRPTTDITVHWLLRFQVSPEPKTREHQPDPTIVDDSARSSSPALDRPPRDRAPVIDDATFESLRQHRRTDRRRCESPRRCPARGEKTHLGVRRLAADPNDRGRLHAARSGEGRRPCRRRRGPFLRCQACR
jgi:hypothetical protein